MTTPTSATAAPAPVTTEAAPTADAGALGATAVETAPTTQAPIATTAPTETAKPVEAAPPAPPAPVELKLPEGLKLPDAELASMKKLFTEAGLDSVKSQKVFDGYLALEQQRMAESEKSFVAQHQQWGKALQSDPDIGGEKWPESKQLIARAFKHFGPTGNEVKDVLTRAGLGNHPGLVKFFVSLGRSLKEDTVAGTASTAPSASASYESVAYPTMFKTKES